jgi:serine/threonine protein kinase
MAPHHLENHSLTAALGAEPGQELHLGLGRTYRLIQPLAPRASTGAVWSAQWLQAQALVALKWLPSDSADRTEVRLQQHQALEREAMALARCQHPHVVRVHALARLPNGEAVLVLEQLFEPLQTHLLRHTDQALATPHRSACRARNPAAGLPVADALRLAHQLALALHALHTSGWRHLDVKPSNLLLSPPGPLGQRLKLADLGACTLLSQPSHTLRGTPGWMAPEQCLPLDDAGPRPRTAFFATDVRTDVFALGQVLFYLLTGQGTAWARQSHAAAQAGSLVGLQPAQRGGCAMSDAELLHLDTVWDQSPPHATDGNAFTDAPPTPANQALCEAQGALGTEPTWHAEPRLWRPNATQAGSDHVDSQCPKQEAATPLRRVMHSLCALQPDGRLGDMRAASRELLQLRTEWARHAQKRPTALQQ